MNTWNWTGSKVSEHNSLKRNNPPKKKNTNVDCHNRSDNLLLWKKFIPPNIQLKIKENFPLKFNCHLFSKTKTTRNHFFLQKFQPIILQNYNEWLQLSEHLKWLTPLHQFHSTRKKIHYGVLKQHHSNISLNKLKETFKTATEKGKKLHKQVNITLFSSHNYNIIPCWHHYNHMNDPSIYLLNSRHLIMQHQN